MRGADGTSINTNHRTCTWKVEMIGGDSIKEEGGNETGGSINKKEEDKNTIALRTDFVIKFERNIQE